MAIHSACLMQTRSKEKICTSGKPWVAFSKSPNPLSSFSRKPICEVGRGQLQQLFLEGEGSCFMNLETKVSSIFNPSCNLEVQRMDKNPSPLLLRDQTSLEAGATPPIPREKAQPVSFQIILPNMASRPGPHNLISSP